MEDETIVLNREDINNIVTDVRASVQAIEKRFKTQKAHVKHGFHE